jgi:hypothetical protein
LGSPIHERGHPKLPAVFSTKGKNGLVVLIGHINQIIVRLPDVVADMSISNLPLSARQRETLERLQREEEKDRAQ